MGQLVGDAKPEDLAQIEGEQNGLTRVLANQPLRSAGAAHTGIVEPHGDAGQACVRAASVPASRR